MTDDAGQRDIFKNHVAKLEKHGEHLEVLEWKEPKSSTYAIWFVRHYGTLMVWGDCYEATYQWNYQEGFDLAWIARCGEDYFIGKCRASPHGREPYVWDQDAARQALQDHFGEFKKPHKTGYEPSDDEVTDRATELEDFERFDGWASLENKFEWDMWCWSHAYDVFGDSWYEGTMGNPGKILGPCISLHLVALKAAMEQIKSQPFKKPEDN